MSAAWASYRGAPAIIDDTEYGVGAHYDIVARSRHGVEVMRAVPDHLVGFARSELRDRHSAGVIFTTARATARKSTS